MQLVRRGETAEQTSEAATDEYLFSLHACMRARVDRSQTMHKFLYELRAIYEYILTFKELDY